MQAQDDFIKTQARCISHEIRNQISICDVYCEIIRKHLQKNNVSIPSVDNALNCIQKSAKMINNSLLDLKSLSVYEFKTLDLNGILFQAVEMSKVYVHDKCVEFVFEPQKSCLINVDENKFSACLINLLKNAIEAIETSGYVKIRTEFNENFAIVKISNNGAKIPEEFAKNIFDEGRTSKSYGSGLGLFICKNNLLSMGANLSLVNSNDEVTEFEIRLPVKNP